MRPVPRGPRPTVATSPTPAVWLGQELRPPAKEKPQQHGTEHDPGDDPGGDDDERSAGLECDETARGRHEAHETQLEPSAGDVALGVGETRSDHVRSPPNDRQRAVLTATSLEPAADAVFVDEVVEVLREQRVGVGEGLAQLIEAIRPAVELVVHRPERRTVERVHHVLEEVVR